MRAAVRLSMLALAISLAMPAAPAAAGHLAGPCDVHQREDESVRSHMKRIIRCAERRWEVEGGSARAICIARVESDLNPEAISADGTYLGLFQHGADAWPDRYETWTRPAWELDPDALSGRTNAIVTIRMVHEQGWGPWSGVEGC